MRSILRALLAWIGLRVRRRASLELEVIALRQQIGILQLRHRHRKMFPRSERYLWILLYRVWPSALKTMRLVQPQTVIRWHRAGFCWLWRRKILDGMPSSRKTPFEIRDLIRKMRAENPTWGPQRIKGELGKLGIKIAVTTVFKYLPRFKAPSPPGWRVFLRNHIHETAAADFFIVVSATYRLLYGFLILQLDRRKILHIDCTFTPTQEWLIDQINTTFKGRAIPKYFIRDRDTRYGMAFRERLKRLGVSDCPISPRSPWQNHYVERLIWSIRRECLNHVIPVSERQLRGLLRSYANYYNYSRTHISLDDDSPVHRRVQRPYLGKTIVSIPEVGGLHHRYERRG